MILIATFDPDCVECPRCHALFDADTHRPFQPCSACEYPALCQTDEGCAEQRLERLP